MKVGDLVRAMGARRGKKIRLGVITELLPALEIGLEVFKVMTSDGKVDTYTSAALRRIKNERR